MCTRKNVIALLKLGKKISLYFWSLISGIKVTPFIYCTAVQLLEELCRDLLRLWFLLLVVANFSGKNLHYVVASYNLIYLHYISAEHHSYLPSWVGQQPGWSDGMGHRWVN
jgi:hypothetical protein